MAVRETAQGLASTAASPLHHADTKTGKEGGGLTVPGVDVSYTTKWI